MRLGPAAAVALCALASVLALPASARAEDPLDSVDGTEGWEEIDTSAVDVADAWSNWRRDLRRWEAGRVRLAAERERMARLARDGRGDEPPPPEDASDPEAHQARIDAARRTARAGGPDRRDGSGQTVDDERPWRRR